MRIVSVINLKGGTAKTTTTINMAYLLAVEHKKRVLVIDNDKQGNASKAFGKYDPEDKNTVAKIMTERNFDVQQIIKKTEWEGIDIVSANMSLLEANLRTIMDTHRQQQTRFKKALKPLDQYDYCIIDNAPDINMSIVNAFVVSDSVIIPVCIDQYSFDGLDILMEQIQEIQEEFNENLKVTGCLVTQYRNDDVHNQGIKYLKQYAPVFHQTIRRTEKKVNESTFARIPLVRYSTRCAAAQDYRKFIMEFFEKTGWK